MKRWIAFLLLILLSGCGVQNTEASAEGLVKTGSLELKYAEQFSVEYYEGGYKLLTIAGADRFLVIPDGAVIPKALPENVTVLQQPLENMYLAATSVMCLFDALDGLDTLRLSGTKAEGWYVENAKKAMEEGKILFAGKYSEPDYELMLAEKCPIAIESNMINHASDVAEKLQELGIAVLVDHSSYETHPLGRTEWIKLYAALLDKEKEAEALFEEQAAFVEMAEKEPAVGKTVAFFSITSSGRVVARKTNDYIPKMIELAGGKYVFENLGDSEDLSSTETIEMETFFASAKDADIIIYNNTMGVAMDTLDDLLAQSELLAECKAVREGNVWCAQQNMFQESTQLGTMVHSFRQIFTGEANTEGKVPYFYHLQ